MVNQMKNYVQTLGFITALLLCLNISIANAQTIKILVHSTYAPDMMDLEDTYSNLEIVTASNHAEFLANVEDCQAIIGSGYEAGSVIKAGKKLKWIQSTSAGVEGYLRTSDMIERDILLTNAKIIQGPEIADHALGLLLNLTRDLKHYNQQMSEGWKRQGNLPHVELRGKTALIVGLGGIGTQTAERCFAFGMNVIAIDWKDIPFMRSVDYLGKPEEFHELLPRADVIISCVPHTKESDKMFDAEAFDLMKDGVYFINVSRGKVVDTPALVKALASGKVAGAGLDVTDPEPLPADHPLWDMPNVTITPHIATDSDGLRARRIALFRDNIIRFVEGRRMRNVVGKEREF
jgi:phosphoglycerate dehydrogenase-like enzyme